jgi:hypothetical protein
LLLVTGCGNGGDQADAGRLWHHDAHVEENGDGDSHEPGEPDRCKPGFYRGSLSGSWVPTAPGGVGATVRGAEADGEGIWLELVDDFSEFGPNLKVERACGVGALQDDDDSWTPLISSVAGKIHCRTGEFKSALRGSYGAPSQTFQGILTAEFSREPVVQLQGAWEVNEEFDGPQGSGTWQARWEDLFTPELPKQCAQNAK